MEWNRIEKESGEIKLPNFNWKTLTLFCVLLLGNFPACAFTYGEIPSMQYLFATSLPSSSAWRNAGIEEHVQWHMTKHRQWQCCNNAMTVNCIRHVLVVRLRHTPSFVLAEDSLRQCATFFVCTLFISFELFESTLSIRFV